LSGVFGIETIDDNANMEKDMKKKTMTLILIAVAITVALVCIVGVIIKSSEPSPVTPPSVTPTLCRDKIK
jgi:flagellar basal body-associated protein FliL